MTLTASLPAKEDEEEDSMLLSSRAEKDRHYWCANVFALFFWAIREMRKCLPKISSSSSNALAVDEPGFIGHPTRTPVLRARVSRE